MFQEAINEQINKKVVKIIKDELNLPNVVDDVDKLHCMGKIKQRNGKKTQDIIIKFKTHTSRYSIYNERKKDRNIKIAPNLIKR